MSVGKTKAGSQEFSEVSSVTEMNCAYGISETLQVATGSILDNIATL